MAMPNKFNDGAMYLWDMAEKELREECKRKKKKEQKAKEEAAIHELVIKAREESPFPDKKPPLAPDGLVCRLDRAEFASEGFKAAEDINQLKEGDYVQVIGCGFGLVSTVRPDRTIEIYFGRDIYRWFSLSLLVKENRIYLYI